MDLHYPGWVCVPWPGESARPDQDSGVKGRGPPDDIRECSPSRGDRPLISSAHEGERPTFSHRPSFSPLTRPQAAIYGRHAVGYARGPHHGRRDRAEPLANRPAAGVLGVKAMSSQDDLRTSRADSRAGRRVAAAVCLLLAITLVAGCGATSTTAPTAAVETAGPSAAVVSTPLETPTRSPATATPTDTPVPTPTPTSVPTPTLGPTPAPEVAIDPDGEVSFEWYHGPRRVFSISIGSSDELTYAGIYGSSKARGVETFNFEIPRVVLDNLRRLLT